MMDLAFLEQLDRQSVGQFLIVAALIMIAVWLLSRRQLRGRDSGGESITPREKIERLKQVGGMREDLRELMVEIEQMARRVGSQLDAKAHRLEKLLIEADQKLEKMRSVAPGTASEGSSDPSPETAEPADPLVAKVYQLADQGRSTVEIAQQLDEQVGKVELMLALRPKSD